MTAAAVSFSWQPAGYVALDANQLLVFPRAGQVPGIYQFAIDHPATGPAVYIGEADKFDQRWQRFRTPGMKPSTNMRLGPLLVDTIRAGGTVAVHVATAVAVTINGDPATSDLRWKPTRLLAENAALLEAQSAGRMLLNRGRDLSGPQ